jgi:hypothetical protein
MAQMARRDRRLKHLRTLLPDRYHRRQANLGQVVTDKSSRLPVEPAAGANVRPQPSGQRRGEHPFGRPPQSRYQGRVPYHRVRHKHCCSVIARLPPPRAKRISGPKKFRSSGEKDFFQHCLPKPEVRNGRRFIQLVQAPPTDAVKEKPPERYKAWSFQSTLADCRAWKVSSIGLISSFLLYGQGRHSPSSPMDFPDAGS